MCFIHNDGGGFFAFSGEKSSHVNTGLPNLVLLGWVCQKDYLETISLYLKYSIHYA